MKYSILIIFLVLSCLTFGQNFNVLHRNMAISQLDTCFCEEKVVKKYDYTFFGKKKKTPISTTITKYKNKAIVKNSTLRFEYDSLGRVIYVTTYQSHPIQFEKIQYSDNSFLSTTYEIDTLKNVEKTIQKTTYYHTSKMEATSKVTKGVSHLHKTIVIYDYQKGNLTKISTGILNELDSIKNRTINTEYSYDKGNMTSIKHYDIYPDVLSETRLVYNDNNQLIEKNTYEDNGFIRKMSITYDSKGLKNSESYTYENFKKGNAQYFFEYNPNGQVIRILKKNKKGKILSVSETEYK